MQSDFQQSNTVRWRCCIIVAAATLLACGADQFDLLAGVRTRMHDALSPGRLVVLALATGTNWSSSVSGGMAATGDADSGEFRQALQVSEQQRRQLIIANARIRNELHALQKSQLADGPAGDPLNDSLVSFQAVTANVISRAGMPDRLRELIIDAGRESNATQQELVVEGSGILIDRGTDHDVIAGSRVLDGAVVVGRITKVARWVSLIEPVGAPGFSSRVRLVRSSGDRVQFGAEGILEGTVSGDCVIRGIPYTEAVSVGDEVVTSDVQGLNGPALYFGRVTEAEFLSGGEWSVKVTPAADLRSLQSVAIVQPTISPADSGSSSDLEQLP